MSGGNGGMPIDPESGPADRRFPGFVYRRGSEPDPRFSLANERTFLAWIRTALALLAAGVALEAVKLPIQSGLRFASAIVFVCLGILAAVQAGIGWVRTERALRDNRALPAPALGVLMIVGIVCAAILLVIGLLL
ncbi:MAG TPA: DUF202 domain-containing protein [Lacisediminihabitans sp.]|uniref:YidH family protein n=1 Tax=Lacisediminihabitans sp. TaxID=2787631 RepID=UPI002ED80C5F